MAQRCKRQSEGIIGHPFIARGTTALPERLRAPKKVIESGGIVPWQDVPCQAATKYALHGYGSFTSISAANLSSDVDDFHPAMIWQ